MMGGFLFVLTLFAALGCAMMAGVFFAFMAALFGTAVACGALAV
jgi:uncharacterized membrane protein